jgi:hypothetical protein
LINAARPRRLPHPPEAHFAISSTALAGADSKERLWPIAKFRIWNSIRYFVNLRIGLYLRKSARMFMATKPQLLVSAPCL